MLVEGFKAAQASAKHKMFESSISRSISTMRNILEEMGASGEVNMESRTLSRHLSVQMAKSLAASQPDHWTPQTFGWVADSTNLSERTLNASRDVLIDGMSGVEAAAKHAMPAPQISRAVTTMRRTREEIVESAQAVGAPPSHVSKTSAVEIAKALSGNDLEFIDAERGLNYKGAVFVNSHGFVVQKAQNVWVIHDLANFVVDPPYNEPIAIFHPMNGSKAIVTALDMPLAKTPKKAVER